MMNIKKLRKLQRFILAEPRRFHLHYWMVEQKNEPNLSEIKLQNPPCGIVACLGGSACLMEGKEEFQGRDWVQELLGISFDQGTSLFFTTCVHGVGHTGFGRGWPKKFDKAYAAAKTPLERAKVAVRRIDHFIKTNGAE